MQAGTLPPVDLRPPEGTDFDPPSPERVADGDGSIHVLHVDDDPQVTELTATCLERLRDSFTVLTETSVGDGLDCLSEEVDCIVSDHQMPGQGGLEFLDIVRDDNPNLPFILFTGVGSEEVARRAIEAGVTDYIHKRSGIDQYEMLADRIEDAVEQYRARQRRRIALSWYRNLVERELVGVHLVQRREFVYVNQRLADIFGYTQGELLGRSPVELADDADRDRLERTLREHERGQTDRTRYRFQGRRSDGRPIDVETHCGTVELNGDPGVLGVLVETHDSDPSR